LALGETRPGLISIVFLERFAADRTIAGAKLIRLQGVENAQRVLRIAADAEIVDVNVLDDVVRVDDEGGAQRNARFRTNAEAVDQRAGRIGELPCRMAFQIRMIAPPGE